MNKTNRFLQTIKSRFAGNKRISNSLVTLSTAAIIAVYAAGYEQTKAAADRFNAQSEQRLASSQAGPAFDQTVPAPVQERTTEGRPSVSVAAASPPSPNTVSSQIAINTTRVSEGTSGPSQPVESSPLAIAKFEAPPVNETIVVANEPRAVEPSLPIQAPPALAPVAAPVAPPAPAPPPHQNLYKDGTFQGWGSSRHGDIQVAVVIQDGRIASAAISQCLTRYPCSWISQLPGQVVSRQAPSVDYVSGATQSVNAYYTAVVEALSRAK